MAKMTPMEEDNAVASRVRSETSFALGRHILTKYREEIEARVREECAEKTASTRESNAQLILSLDVRPASEARRGMPRSGG